MSAFTYGLNTGNYFGNGYNYSTSATNSNAANSKVASSVNLNRVARDIAQGYNQDIEVVNLYLQQGNLTQALLQYDELIESAKATANEYGYSLTDNQVTSIVNQAYYNTTGSTFVNTVDSETHSPFVTGLIEGIPVLGWFFGQSYSDAEAIAKVSGTKVRGVDKIAEATGAIASGAAAGAAIGAICPIGGPVIGAVIGGVAGALSCLIKGAVDKN